MAEELNNLILGRHAVNEALSRDPESAGELLVGTKDSGRAVKNLLNLARAAGVKVRRVERARLDLLSNGANHQGVVLFTSPAAYTPFEDMLEAAAKTRHPLLLITDHIMDPHNLGAVIRSAAAYGAQGVVIAKDRACPLTPAVGKASAGSLAIIPVSRVTNLANALEMAKEAGLWSLAACAHGEPPPWELDLNLPLALVIGGEQKGVSPRLLSKCDLKTTLPLSPQVESLNASVAAGVLLYEAARQQGR